MRFTINVHFRRFDGPRENEDSGYYNQITNRKTGRIDVNLEDDPFEQALTIFHEVTHMIFDLFSQYEFDNEKQTVVKRDQELKNSWRIYNKKIEKCRRDKQSREELICCKLEEAIRLVLLREIPKKFLKKFFTKGEKRSIIENSRRTKHGN